MATWLEDIIQAFHNLNGLAPYQVLYKEVQKIRETPMPKSWKAIIRRTIEKKSSDSKVFSGNQDDDLFYSVEGLGSGIWGLRKLKQETIYAIDILEPIDTVREETTVYRILRDTYLARRLKQLHNNECQICGESIKLSNQNFYSEAHHIKPLGKPHNGPDIAENILVLCPNHHVQCDYGAINLNINTLKIVNGHKISNEFIKYHNTKVYKKNDLQVFQEDTDIT
ncbi:HNH endonuclease [Paenibacillus dauci]|uniref:HNH endonuclease n=1 Tax=Paenibacillus dauci TaxID=1567106 RepID=UPI00061974CB|nr:HNH endonuclease [Paenibacillus dauci]